MPELDSEALDFRAASESFAAFRTLASRDLETLWLLTEHRGRQLPTVGGMILFGKDRERHFPEAWIQAGRFAGTDKSRIVDQAEIRSHPARAIGKAIAFVERHDLYGVEIGAVRRDERWNPPPAAIREAIISAVARADHSQRGARSASRSSTTASRSSVRAFASSASRPRTCLVASRSCATGLSAASPARTGRPALDETDQSFATSLAGGKGRLTSEVAAAIGLTPRATRTRLARLVGNGLVREIGTGPQDPKRR